MGLLSTFFTDRKLMLQMSWDIRIFAESIHRKSICKNITFSIKGELCTQHCMADMCSSRYGPPAIQVDPCSQTAIRKVSGVKMGLSRKRPELYQSTERRGSPAGIRQNNQCSKRRVFVNEGCRRGRAGIGYDYESPGIPRKQEVVL